MNYKKNIIILLLTLFFINGCKKDNTRTVEFKWDRYVWFDNLNDNYYDDNCIPTGKTFVVDAGTKINYQVYSNCSGTPKKEAHVTVSVSNGKKKKVVYEATAILHKVSLTID
jgi:hypothetical protein